jgi:hypothetical protein
MQLKIQRSQRMGGVVGGTVVFCVDALAEYTRPEADNVQKYKLGKQVIYNSRAAKRHLERSRDRTDGSATGYLKGAFSLAMAALSLNISIDSLGRGQHIECKDLEELLEAEDALMTACRTLTRYLAIAETFNGSIALIDFADGEKLHTGQGSLDLISAPTSGLLEFKQSDSSEFDTWLDRLENLSREEWIRYGAFAGVVAVLIGVLVECR